jgi:hypothetical protein
VSSVTLPSVFRLALVLTLQCGGSEGGRRHVSLGEWIDGSGDVVEIIIGRRR